jgi:hypothetical protein
MSKEMRENKDRVKNWKQFLNEGITSNFNIGDEIFYQSNRWSYKENKNIITKEKAKIVDMYDYDDKNWGTLNVRIIPERKELCDKDGGLWISETNIISKV